MKCPKCNEEIEELEEERTQKAYYTLNIGGDYQLNEYGSVLKSRFYCPLCDSQLFDSEENALKFLDVKTNGEEWDEILRKTNVI